MLASSSRAGSPAGRPGADARLKQSGHLVKAHRDAPLAGEPSDRDGEVALAGADGPVEHSESSHPATKSRFSSCARPSRRASSGWSSHGKSRVLSAGKPACLSRRRRLDRSRESSSAVNHPFDEVSSWLGVKRRQATAGEHAACQGSGCAHLQDAFAFLGRGRAPASGLQGSPDRV